MSTSVSSLLMLVLRMLFHPGATKRTVMFIKSRRWRNSAPFLILLGRGRRRKTSSTEMAQVYFYYSAMNAGKSTSLLQSSYNYQERGMKTLLLKLLEQPMVGGFE